MKRIMRLLSGSILLAAMVLSSSSLADTQADTIVIHGTAAANASVHALQAPSILLPSKTLQIPFPDVGTPTPGSTAFYIVSVTMAKAVQGQDNSPINPTSVFAATDTFHAVVMIQDAPANTNFTSIWYAVDVGSAAQPNTVIDTAQVLTDGTRNVDFSLMPQTNSSWPAGTYAVEVDVNGVKGAEIFFSVQ